MRWIMASQICAFSSTSYVDNHLCFKLLHPHWFPSVQAQTPYRLRETNTARIPQHAVRLHNNHRVHVVRRHYQSLSGVGCYLSNKQTLWMLHDPHGDTVRRYMICTVDTHRRLSRYCGCCFLGVW